MNETKPLPAAARYNAPCENLPYRVGRKLLVSDVTNIRDRAAVAMKLSIAYRKRGRTWHPGNESPTHTEMMHTINTLCRSGDAETGGLLVLYHYGSLGLYAEDSIAAEYMSLQGEPDGTPPQAKW